MCSRLTEQVCVKIGVMVEETEVNELKKKGNETRRSQRKLGRSAIWAVLVLIIALGAAFFHTQKGKPCPCFQVLLLNSQCHFFRVYLSYLVLFK